MKVKNLHFSETNQNSRNPEFWIWNKSSLLLLKITALSPCSDRQWWERTDGFFLAHFDQTFLPIDWSAISNEKLGSWAIKFLQWKNVLIINCSLDIILGCHLDWGTDSLPFSTLSLGDRKRKVSGCNTLACTTSERSRVSVTTGTYMALVKDLSLEVRSRGDMVNWEANLSLLSHIPAPMSGQLVREVE